MKIRKSKSGKSEYWSVGPIEIMAYGDREKDLRRLREAVQRARDAEDEAAEEQASEDLERDIWGASEEEEEEERRAAFEANELDRRKRAFHFNLVKACKARGIECELDEAGTGSRYYGRGNHCVRLGDHRPRTGNAVGEHDAQGRDCMFVSLTLEGDFGMGNIADTTRKAVEFAKMAANWLADAEVGEAEDIDDDET